MPGCVLCPSLRCTTCFALLQLTLHRCDLDCSVESTHCVRVISVGQLELAGVHRGIPRRCCSWDLLAKATTFLHLGVTTVLSKSLVAVRSWMASSSVTRCSWAGSVDRCHRPDLYDRQVRGWNPLDFVSPQPPEKSQRAFPTLRYFTKCLNTSSFSTLLRISRRLKA